MVTPSRPDAGRRDATRKRRLGLFHEERRGHQKSRKIAFRSAETAVVNPDLVGHALWKRRQWLHPPERGSRLTARRSGGRRSRRPRGGLPRNTGFVRKLKCEDRKSTRLNSSHTVISYAVFCL